MIRTLFSALWKTFFLLVTLLFIGSYFSAEICSLAEKSIALPSRALLASFFGVFPFPVFELLALLLIPLLLFVLIRYFKGKGSISPLMFLVQFVFVTYALSLGINGASENTNISSQTALTKEDRVAVMNKLCEQLNEISDELSEGNVAEDGAVMTCVSTYVKNELNVKTVSIPRVKSPVIASLSDRLGLEAYYAFPTGEIIVNSSAPKTVRTFDIAHELMHFFGITGEDSATYYAFCAMEQSENNYLKYCARLYAFCLIGNELYRQSADEYYQILDQVSPRVTKDLEERYGFFSNIRSDKALGELSQELNDVAITMRDERGSQSYSYAAVLLENLIFNKYCN